MAYSPASNLTTTGSLAHLATVWYDKVAVDNLKANLPFVAATERRTLPKRSGKTIQMFGYEVLTANTTPGTEGTVGTGISPTTHTASTSLNQYYDFMSFSDLLIETAIDPIVENSAGEMGYRAALTTNSLTSSAFEAAVAGSVNIPLADNEFFTAAIARQAVMSLRGQNARPKADGMFYGIIHPFVSYDLLNDNTAGGVIDILKHVQSGVNELTRGVQGYRVIELSGVRYIETTTVPTYANYPSTGKTGYATYVVGKDAIFTVSLGATQVPNEKNFRLITRNWEPDKSDPAGVIGASIAYNFKFAALARPNAVPTFRRVQSEASIS
jgi:N4-gp56 family major capsid protein